jgi:hypothetical protein
MEPLYDSTGAIPKKEMPDEDRAADVAFPRYREPSVGGSPSR